MASYKAKFRWKQNTEFKTMAALRDALTTEKNEVTGQASSITQKEEYFQCYLDIIDDFAYETKSNFENVGDQLSGLNSFISSVIGFLDKINTLSALGGKESPFSQFLKLQGWKDTEPFRMSFQFNLNTKTDPFIDVYAPAMALMSMSILSVKDGQYYTPGINFKNMNMIQQKREEEKKQSQTKKPDPKKGGTVNPENSEKAEGDKILAQSNASSSKLIDTFSIITTAIKGVSDAVPKNNSGDNSSPDEISLLTVNGCFIESCKPTWSKERTSSGIPLWCNLDVTIQSIFSANDDMFGIIKPRTGGVGVTVGGGSRVVATNIFR